jgi:CHRD domain
MKKLFVAAAALATCWAGAAFADGSNSQLTASLDGPSVLDGGDSNGTGSFSAAINSDNDTLCYSLSVANMGAAGDAHIHEGRTGEPGRPVIQLSVTSGSCISVSHATLEDMAENPSDYYVDVVHADTGHDAVRGQINHS